MELRRGRTTMDSLKDLLAKREPIKKVNTNPIWLKAEEITAVVGEKPERWLRLIKTKPNACQRALDAMRELPPKNTPAAYFIYLVKNVYG